MLGQMLDLLDKCWIYWANAGFAGSFAGFAGSNAAFAEQMLDLLGRMLDEILGEMLGRMLGRMLKNIMLPAKTPTGSNFTSHAGF